MKAKIKNALWVAFIIIAVIFTGFNVFHIWSVYKGNERQQAYIHQHDENCEHEHIYFDENSQPITSSD